MTTGIATVSVAEGTTTRGENGVAQTRTNRLKSKLPSPSLAALRLTLCFVW